MPSKIKIEIRAELRNPQGKLIKRLPWKRANSLLKQFIQVLQVQASQTSIDIKRTDGTTSAQAISSTAFKLNAAAANTNWGVIIGTGTTPVTMADFTLEARVYTNIVFGVPSFAAENPDASTWRLAIARTFLNQTGASLGIREVGLAMPDSNAVAYILLDHSLYSVDVPNGVTVTLTYRITVSL